MAYFEVSGSKIAFIITYTQTDSASGAICIDYFKSGIKALLAGFQQRGSQQ
jgi:hypothetical protein